MTESLVLAKSLDLQLPPIVWFVFHSAPQHNLCHYTGEPQHLIKGR